MLFFKPEKIREDFPLLKKGITYLDSACVTLRPTKVIEAMNRYYTDYSACEGRSAHRLSAQVGEEVRSARESLRKFINAKDNSEIIFTRNATEGINLIANSFKKGHTVVSSDKEHNSNLVPWLSRGIKRITIPTDNGFDIEMYKKSLSSADIVSVVWTSNLDGTSHPVKDIVKLAHAQNVPVILDAAQAAPHQEIDVKSLGVDAVAFSAHKMMGPSGMGALYMKKSFADTIQPFMTGGQTVKNTWQDRYELEEIPRRFEAGLQDYAGIIGFGAACDYLKKIGLGTIHKHDIKLNTIITEGLNDAVRIIGPTDPKLRGGIFGFHSDKDPHETALLLDKMHNIQVRSGMHCVHSWFNSHKLPGNVRASTYIYNTEAEAQQFVDATIQILKLGK